MEIVACLCLKESSVVSVLCWFFLLMHLFTILNCVFRVCLLDAITQYRSLFCYTVAMSWIFYSVVNKNVAVFLSIWFYLLMSYRCALCVGKTVSVYFIFMLTRKSIFVISAVTLQNQIDCSILVSLALWFQSEFAVKSSNCHLYWLLCLCTTLWNTAYYQMPVCLGSSTPYTL